MATLEDVKKERAEKVRLQVGTIATEQKDDFQTKIFNLFYNCGIKCISGKYFNEDDTPVKDIKRTIQELSIKNFGKPLDSTHYKYALESISVNPDSDDYGIWKRLPLWDKGKEAFLTDNYGKIKLSFDLEIQQYIIIYYYVYKPQEEIMFICSGVGGSGKSTFLNLMRQLFDNDVSNTPLNELSKEFVRGKAIEARLICSDEINSDDLDNGVIKTLISKQAIIKNIKGRDPVEVLTQSWLLYNCNKEPRIDVTDSGLLRRIKFYRRDTKIKNPDPSKKSIKFTEEELIEYLARSIRVYNRILASGQDPLSLFNEDTKYFLLLNNSVSKYFNKNGLHPAKDHLTYILYSAWCRDYGFRPYNLTNFEEIVDYILSLEGSE